MKNKKQTLNKGFTLIELMIAVAVISILAAIAVPTYRDYTIRAKISEALNVAASAKISITEYYISEGKLPANLDEAGLENVATDYIKSFDYTGDENRGRMTMTLADGIGGDAAGKKIIVETVPIHDGALLKWNCAPAKENGVDKKYLPANCRR